MEIDLSNLICPKCLKCGYVNYIGQSYKYIAKCYNCGFYFETGTFLKEVSEKKTNNVTTNADRTDDLLKFAKWVAESVCVSDDKWEGDCWAFQEIACRRLVKLGIIQKREDKYIYEYEEGDGE